MRDEKQKVGALYPHLGAQGKKRKDLQVVSEQGPCTHTLEPPLTGRNRRGRGEGVNAVNAKQMSQITKTKGKDASGGCLQWFDEITAPRTHGSYNHENHERLTWMKADLQRESNVVDKVRAPRTHRSHNHESRERLTWMKVDLRRESSVIPVPAWESINQTRTRVQGRGG